MEFLKSSELTLNPANYLISKVTNKPVTHLGFVRQQQAADYIVRLANAIKDKNFTHGKIDDLQAIKNQVKAEINKAATKTYVPNEVEPVSKVQDELAQHALDFIAFVEKQEKVDHINTIMQEYNVIAAIEEVGDYFSEGLTQINKIYSINEILEAVKTYSEKVG
jgi:hypothetical protein